MRQEDKNRCEHPDGLIKGSSILNSARGNDTMAKLIFLSHRHNDHEIASAFSKNFQTWGVAPEEIFQSSDYQASTVIGAPLKPQLKQALCEARLVLLIYTISDNDWEFCVWECGVATNLKDETQETRVALFQMSNHACRVFQDEVVFTLHSGKDIAKFVEQFHRHKGFFKKDAAFQPSINENILRKRADDLYNDLIKFSLPELEERYRWDRFTLWISSNMMQEVRECNKTARSESSQTDKALDILRNNAEVVDAFGQALPHFGYTAEAKDLTLGILIARWRETFAGAGDPQGWIQQLCEEMNRSIEDRPSEPSWELMRSALYPQWWFCPILNHVRLKPDGSFEFDVYLYRVPGALPAMQA
jgi:hypothetical protein